MSQTPPQTSEPAGHSLLEMFMAFPAPLALLDTDGWSERVNTRYRQRFGASEVSADRVGAFIRDVLGDWQDIALSLQDRGVATEVRVRAMRTASHIVLIVDEPGSAAYSHALDALLARIGDLERLAATDHPTGAWNRAHLDRVIESELARSLANRQPLSLVLFDVEYSKKINDSVRHAVGDQVLRELVRLVRSRIRASDLVFRWDDEELVVLVSSAGYRGAERVAENLRQAVAGHAFEGMGAVTVSLGVAEHDGDEDAPAWFRRLDEALHEAKQAGRNRIVVSPRGNSDAWAAKGGPSAQHLVWQAGYECGDATIDSGNRELFRLANKLIDAASREHEQPEGVRAALGELLGHLVRHFADEEAILERLHYAQLPEHRRAHAGLVGRARVMTQRLEARESSLDAVVEFIVQDVVARHVLVVDRAFFPMFLKLETTGSVAAVVPSPQPKA